MLDNVQKANAVWDALNKIVVEYVEGRFYDGARKVMVASEMLGTDSAVRLYDILVKATPGGGWVTWEGGVQPVVNGTVVEYGRRCDEKGKVQRDRAENLRWNHFPEGNKYDIVRYRVRYRLAGC